LFLAHHLLSVFFLAFAFFKDFLLDLFKRRSKSLIQPVLIIAVLCWQRFTRNRVAIWILNHLHLININIVLRAVEILS